MDYNLVFFISFAAIVACYNYCVIQSYEDKYNKGYKDLWHYLQSAMVLLVLAYHVSDLKEFVAFGLVYYVTFESLLNLLRQENIFYVSKDGSKSDRVRYIIYSAVPKIVNWILWKFGSKKQVKIKVEVIEGIIKITLIIIASWIR